MKVNFIKEHSPRVSIKTDWRLYQLIIFNIIQNAVKYNKREGCIKVETRLVDTEDPTPNQMVFETIISDEGDGIQ